MLERGPPARPTSTSIERGRARPAAASSTPTRSSARARSRRRCTPRAAPSSWSTCCSTATAPYGVQRPPSARPPRRARRARWASACSTTSPSPRSTRSTRTGCERVMILDWDVHHGNGTNDIFHASAEVLFVSIHQSPLYPGTGAGRRRRRRSRARASRSTCRCRRGPATTLFVSLVEHVVVPLARAFDAAAGADLGRLRRPPRRSAGRLRGDRGGLRGDGRARCASVRAELGAPLGCVLEGGYALGALARSVAATLEALAVTAESLPERGRGLPAAGTVAGAAHAGSRGSGRSSAEPRARPSEHALRHQRRPSTRSAPARGRRPRIVARRGAARARRASAGSNGAAVGPVDARRAPRARSPTGVAEHRHVARQRLEHREPEPLALGGHQHRVGGVDPQRHLRRDRRRRAPAAARRRRPPARGRSASRGGLGRPGTAGRGRRGRARARARASARAIGRKRSVSTPQGSTAAAARRPARDLARAAARTPPPTRSMSAQRRERDRAASGGGRGRCRGASPPARGPAAAERRPRGQAEVGVDDVEARRGERRRSSRGARDTRRAAGREREHLDVDVAERGAAPATWSRTKLPSAGRSRVGYMLVTISARIGGASVLAARPDARTPAPSCASAPCARAVRSSPIGVFDSGVGGLTVLHELLVSLPDRGLPVPGRHGALPLRRSHARRSCERSRSRSPTTCSHEGAKLLVVACNSASAAALDALERHLASDGRDVDVIGVRRPAAQLAVAGAAPAGSACWRRRPPSRAAPTSAPSRAPTPTSTSRASPARTWLRSSRAASRSTRRWSRPCAATARRCAPPRSTP